MLKALRREKRLLIIAQLREIHTSKRVCFFMLQRIASQALGWALILRGER